MTFKAILGYDVVPGMTQEEYDDWLFSIHVPDLLSNPYLDRIVLNKVLGPVTQASGGSVVPQGQTFYRISELHFADADAYTQYRRWFDEHPLAAERGPSGRTDFRFYILAESIEVTR